MPRGPRLDAPGCLHHVILRGIERCRIFHDDWDRRDLHARLSRILPEAGMRCFAWALMPNHVHLVLRTGPMPLARVMARINTGFARSFNQRHVRVGYLFQGRYKSILVAAETQLLALVRYVHLNPLRAGLVSSRAALARYPWSGHATLMGHHAAPFQDVQEILQRFDSATAEARRLLEEWMRVEPDPEPPPAAGDRHVARHARIGEGLPDERLPHRNRRRAREPRRVDPERRMRSLVARVCEAREVAVDELLAGVRIRPVADARAEIAYRACSELGLSGSAVARALGISKGALSHARVRGRVLVVLESEDRGRCRPKF